MQIHVPTRLLLVLVLAASARAQSTCSGFETSRLFSSDLAQADHFGASTDMAADVLVIGAPGESFGLGAAYVFRWNGSAWIEEQKLVAGSPYPQQGFGTSVAADGDRIAVGSSGEKCMEVVYLFRFASGTWVEEQRLVPSVASHCNRFGGSVALSGDVLVVGAERDNLPSGNQHAGSAFVYRFDGTQWIEEQKLRSSNLAVDDRFGHRVDVDGNRLVVGAPRVTFFPTGVPPGSVYSFRKTAGGWVQEQELSASDGFASNGFGESLSLQGNTLAVGSLASYVPGAAYLYTHDGTTWGNEHKVFASDGADSNEFGSSIARDGDRLVVGAQNHDAQGTAAGAAYLFLESGGTWTQALELLTNDGVNGNRLGGAAALSGDRLVLGSEQHDVVGSDSGAAFVYDLGLLPNCPVGYCTPKTASVGCIPTLGFVGSPSATATGPFSIRATDVINRRPAMLVYGPSPAATPFRGGTLCVAPPVHRTPVTASTGNAHPAIDCSGSLSFGMNYWIQHGSDPSLVPGVTVYAQFWFRDPLDAFGIGLTDALSFVINP